MNTQTYTFAAVITLFILLVYSCRSARSGSTSKTIEGSVSQLTCYVQLVTDSIFGSVVHCPTVLRQALKLLWQRVSAKFPDEVGKTESPSF